MTDFFGIQDASDEGYETLKGSDRPAEVEAREAVRRLWQETEKYLDRDARERASRQFHQVFWEMYLCAGLVNAGLPVIERASRRRRGCGPDLQVGDVDAWSKRSP